MYDKLVTQFNGGSAPDVIHFEAAGIRPFAVDGYLADLTDYVSDDLWSALAYAAAVTGALYSSCLISSAQMMRAVLLAKATAANFGGLRLRSPASQGDGLPPR